MEKKKIYRQFSGFAPPTLQTSPTHRPLLEHERDYFFAPITRRHHLFTFLSSIVLGR